MGELTFATVTATNRTRCGRWHPGFPNDGWTGADWSNAVCGEAGEMANVVKKLRRIEFGTPGAKDPERDVLLDMLVLRPDQDAAERMPFDVDGGAS